MRDATYVTVVRVMTAALTVSVCGNTAVSGIWGGDVGRGGGSAATTELADHPDRDDLDERDHQRRSRPKPTEGVADPNRLARLDRSDPFAERRPVRVVPGHRPTRNVFPSTTRPPPSRRRNGPPAWLPGRRRIADDDRARRQSVARARFVGGRRAELDRHAESQ